MRCAASSCSPALQQPCIGQGDVRHSLSTLSLLPLPATRLDIALGDWRAVKGGIEKAKALCAKGGDWERKNKLKVR